MMRQGLRYTIASENNPYWIMAEPILLHIWADGIPKASVLGLHITNAMSFVISAIGFLIGVFLRAAIVSGLFFAIYLAIPEIVELPSSNSIVHQIIAFLLIISSAVFVLGERLFLFIGECLIYLCLAATNMLPLRLLAYGLRNDKYVAQFIAKTPFMGMFIVQTVGDLPKDSQSEWKQIFDLYNRSNTPAARAELEELAANWPR